MQTSLYLALIHDLERQELSNKGSSKYCHLSSTSTTSTRLLHCPEQNWHNSQFLIPARSQLMVSSGGISTALRSKRNGVLRASKCKTETLEIVMPLLFTNPILYRMDLAQFFVSSNEPPFSFSKGLSHLQTTPVPYAIGTDVLTCPALL